MPKLTSKSQLATCSESFLDCMAEVIMGTGRPKAYADDNWVEWWPPPWGEWYWQLFTEVFGPCPYQRRFCKANDNDATSLADSLASACGVTRQQGWSNRDVVEECLWVKDQAGDLD